MASESTATTAAPSIRVAVPNTGAPRTQLGEGPSWDARSETLLWVDILRPAVHVYTPATGDNRVLGPLPSRVGAVVPTSSDPNLALAALEDGFYSLDLTSGETRLVASVEASNDKTRFNDGKVDPSGRFWCGSMDLGESSPLGALYRLDTDGTVTKQVDGVTISNGLAWTEDAMYYIDTPTREVVRYAYDDPTGDIDLASRAVVVTFPHTDASDGTDMGWPDGMCIDDAGMLWIASWGGSRVSQWDPSTGAMLRSVRMPAERITCPAFGTGAHAHTLFATSATVGMGDDDCAACPEAGALMAVTGLGDVTGSPINGRPFGGDVAALADKAKAASSL